MIFTRLTLAAFFLLLLPFGPSQAANPDPVQALSLYPAVIRQAVVGALKYPQALLAVANIQDKTSAAFRSQLSGLPKATQQDVAQLLPYPKLIRALVAEGSKDPKDLAAVLKNYPNPAQAAARKLLAENPELLKQLDAMGNQANAQFESAIQSLPSSGQVAYRTLVQHSEVLKILHDELNLQSASIAAYQKNPQELNAKIQGLATRLNAAPPPTKADWAPSPGDDPATVASLKKAEDKMDGKLDYEMNVDPKPKGAVQANVNFSPYPFYNPYAGGFYVPYWYGFGGPFW